MSIGGYKIRNQQAIRFITFATVEWIDVFTNQIYRDILLDSVRHCQEHKGLLVHAWCVMSNHTHWMLSAKNNYLSDVLRDFKKFTGKSIINAIAENKHENRKDWMMRIFREQGAENSRNKEFQFWRQDNQPKECYSPSFITQKLDYIHNNPVAAGIVELPKHYIFSSARDYLIGMKVGLLNVEILQ
jgi:REP element-mobilizing transposase RayT